MTLSNQTIHLSPNLHGKAIFMSDTASFYKNNWES